MKRSWVLGVGVIVAALVEVSGCSGQSVTDENTVWDLVACSVDDDGFNVIDEVYAAAIDDLGGESQVQSDTNSDAGALAVRAADKLNELNALQAQMEADSRVTSTHRGSTISAACFG